MKKILLILIFSTIPFSSAIGNGEATTPYVPPLTKFEKERIEAARLIEPDAAIGEFKDPNAAIRELVGVVRDHGYKCDSVSGAFKLFTKPGFDLYCNGDRYKYQVVDMGGRWTACLNKCK